MNKSKVTRRKVGLWLQHDEYEQQEIAFDDLNNVEKCCVECQVVMDQKKLHEYVNISNRYYKMQSELRELYRKAMDRKEKKK